MNRYAGAIKKRLTRALLRLYLRPAARGDLEKLGSEYGGWVIPTSLISDDSVCYCVGAGEDITFDLELIARFGCQVFTFDPTPRAEKHIKGHAHGTPQFHFYPIGLWSNDEVLKFYAPKNPDHVSHSVVNLQNTASFFEAECKRLSSLMKELGHSRLDLLKLDIEGAEHEVLKSMIEDGLDVKVVCVEFDQPCPVSRVINTTRSLVRFGYTLVSIDSWNYTFVRNHETG